MDFLRDLVATHVESAWQSEQNYDRFAADSGISPDHAGHLLRFAVRQIADGDVSTADPYALATSWISAR